MSDNKNPKLKVNPWLFYGLAIGILILISLFGQGLDFSNPKPTTLSKFYQYLDSSQVEKVTFSNSKASIYLKETALTDEEHKKVKQDVFGKLNTKGSHYFTEIGNIELFQKTIEEARQNGKLASYDKEPESIWGELLGFLLPFILIAALWIFMMRRMSGGGAGGGGQIFNIGKSKAKLFDEKNDIKVTFENVAGLEGAKEEIEEIVEFLKNPEKYTSIGGKIPKGALLVGPPGTGKTLLAKAVAGEAKVPFFSLSGSDFVEMFVGVGASRVRRFIQTSQRKSSCYYFY